MASPRYAPAGLLIEAAEQGLMIDGGKGAEPGGKLDGWLVTDEHAELISEIRRLAAAHGLRPAVKQVAWAGLVIEPHPVVHTNHPSFGYEIVYGDHHVVWAPEFWSFPEWAAEADLAFLEAAAWNRPIRFRGGVGGHAPVQRTSKRGAGRGNTSCCFRSYRPTDDSRHRRQRAQCLEFAKDGQAFEFRNGRLVGRPPTRGSSLSGRTGAAQTAAGSAAHSGRSRPGLGT